MIAGYFGAKEPDFPHRNRFGQVRENRDQKKPALRSRPDVTMQANTTSAKPQTTASALTRTLATAEEAASVDIFVTLFILTPNKSRLEFRGAN
jgi:hypothetical protein